MPVEELHIIHAGEGIGIGGNLHGVPVALVHDDAANILPENLWQKRKGVLLFIGHGLGPVA